MLEPEAATFTGRKISESESNKRNLNILLVSDDLLPGGISRHLVDLANGLSSQGHRITIAASPGRYMDQFVNNVKFVPLKLTYYNSFRKNWTGFILSYITLFRLTLFNSFDIIHSHKRIAHFLVSCLPKRSAKHITSYHNVFRNKHLFSKFGDYTICCSDAVKRMVINRYGRDQDRVTTVYNGINPFTLYDEKRKIDIYKSLSLPATTKVISSVGQFIESKDRESLINAVALLNEERQLEDIVFVLLGYGPLLIKLQHQVARLNLRQKVIFLDETVSVEGLFNISEFMILNPQDSEGFGIVLLEAASIGKMHIGTAIGGIPEFIENDITGTLIPPRNARALADAISYLLARPAESSRMGQNALRKYEANFKKKDMINSVEHIYLDVLNNITLVQSGSKT